jgi:hypothetical protein
MKSYYTPPKNQQFFQSYHRLTPTLRLMGYLAQVITALAEMGISYRLILSSVQEVFPEHAVPAAIFGAVAVTVFLEVGLRKFLPYSFRAILYRRFSGLHLLITVPVLLITVALVVALGYLSVQGSHEIVRQIAPDPQVIPEDPILLRSEDDRENALSLWRSDSALLEQQFLSLQRGVEARYRRKIERNPDAGAQQAVEIGLLERKKTDALLDAGRRRDERLAQIAADRRVALERVSVSNKSAAEAVSVRTSRYGGGLAWFTLIAMGVFIFSIGIEEVHRKGSGMTEVVVPGYYSFSPGLIGELRWAVENRLNYRLRAKIREFEALTPLLEELEKEPPKVNKTPEMPVYQHAKPCKQCGKPYLERTTWQLFCSKKCRLSFHETKHGRPYLPHKLYRARQHNMNGKKLALELFEG